jgi:hypothetical protein
MNTRSLPFAALVAAFLLAAPALAQTYALRADVVASGGGDASGSGYTLRGTVGEPAAGPVAGGAYALGQGFWYPATNLGPSGPLVDLTLVPLDPPPPVQIQRGEVLRYRAEFAIAANGPSSFEYWAEAVLPNNQVRFLFGPVTVNGTPGTTVTLNLQLRIPNTAPLGDYVFRMKVGQYPGTVYDEDSFPVTIIPGEALAARAAERTAGRGRGSDAPSVRRAPGDAAEAQAAARRALTVQRGAVRAAEIADVPAEVARRIAAAPEAWLAWDQDGTILEAGVVQDLRFAALDPTHNSAAQAEGDAAGEAAADPAVSASRGEVPEAVVLVTPFPNPSAERATVRFGLPAPGPVRLAVYDALGRRVAVLFEGAAEAGWHEAALFGPRLAGGLYLVRLEAAGQVRTRPITLLR